MFNQSFSLHPFPLAGPVPRVEIAGLVTRHGDTFTIGYHLQGRLAEVLIPAPQRGPLRRHRLWEKTCFEFFLAPGDLPQYWEFNLSPNGSWNVYRFTGYRQGMTPEETFVSLPLLVQKWPNSLRLDLEIDLAGIVPAAGSLKVAIAAVIQGIDGRLTYWALTHPGPQPDFHDRAGFLLAA